MIVTVRLKGTVNVFFSNPLRLLSGGMYWGSLWIENKAVLVKSNFKLRLQFLLDNKYLTFIRVQNELTSR